MSERNGRGGLSRSVRLGLLVGGLAALAIGLIVWYQAREEYRTSLEDLDRRAAVLAFRVRPVAVRALGLEPDAAAAMLGERLEGHSRLLGLAVFGPDGRLLAAGKAVKELGDELAAAASRVNRQRPEAASVVALPGGPTHVLATLVEDGVGEGKAGVLVVAHEALYLEERLTRGMVRGLGWAMGVAVVLFAMTSGLAWALFERPLHALAEWMRKLRFGSPTESPPGGLPVRKLADESVHLAASFRAARVKERESASETARSDKVWTRERLRAHALAALDGRPLVVVSNREPYMHQIRGGKPALVRPASGLVTGLDPVLRACGGLWVAHGAGDGDRATVDAADCLPVPPEDPRYTLRRVWITKEEEQGYYYGFSNEGLWPLCHLTHERPVFRSADWAQYVRANRRFADAVLEEIGEQSAVVLVQDYQLALVPGMIKSKRPDVPVGLFWHIPWPNPEAFRICPFRAELLHGMLGADVVGFHLQQHCNNFLDTVDRMVEARLDWDRFAAEVRGRQTLVRPFPISVQLWSEREAEGMTTPGEMELRQRYGLGDVPIAVGVDRIDYTKGIAERLRAVERFFERCPDQRGRFSFVQLGAPSRTHIPRYRDLVTELEAMADAINWKFKADNQGWKPIHFLVDHHEGPTVHGFLKMASVCVVSSLHDGMNLVSKEFVAAQGEMLMKDAERANCGVLVLSEFAGAARDLPDALVINPYDTEAFAAALQRAAEMPPAERRDRMARMFSQVAESNIYRWAAELLVSVTQAGAGSGPAGVAGGGVAEVVVGPAGMGGGRVGTG